MVRVLAERVMQARITVNTRNAAEHDVRLSDFILRPGGICALIEDSDSKTCCYGERYKGVVERHD